MKRMGRAFYEQVVASTSRQAYEVAKGFRDLRDSTGRDGTESAT
jgi:hypothetical protein